MSRRAGLRGFAAWGCALTIGGVLLVAPTTAWALGDAVHVGKTREGDFAFDAVSGPGQTTALLLTDREFGTAVVYQDDRGRWHRFTVPGSDIGDTLALIGDGGGLVAFAEGTSVSVRRWHRDGSLEPVGTVLMGVAIHEDDEQLNWSLGHNGLGTVALIGASAAGGLYASVLEQGARASLPPATDADDRSGTPVAIRRRRRHGHRALVLRHGPGCQRHQQAVRTKGGTFGAPTDSPPDAAPAADELRDAITSERVRIGLSLQAICARDTGCGAAQRFGWPDGTQAIAMRSNDSGGFYDPGGDWYMAGLRPGGAFDQPVRISRVAYGDAVWTPTAGVIALTHMAGGGVYLVPTAPPKLAPKPAIEDAGSRDGQLVMRAWCRSGCRLTARLGRHTAHATVEPAVRIALRLPVGAATRVRVTLTARDARGRTRRIVRTLHRGARDERGWYTWSVN